MLSTPVRSARCFQASARARPARCSSTRTPNSSHSSGCALLNSSAVRAVAWSRLRPASIQITSRSSTSGRAPLHLLLPGLIILPSQKSGARNPSPRPMRKQKTGSCSQPDCSSAQIRPEPAEPAPCNRRKPSPPTRCGTRRAVKPLHDDRDLRLALRQHLLEVLHDSAASRTGLADGVHERLSASAADRSPRRSAVAAPRDRTAAAHRSRPAEISRKM